MEKESKGPILRYAGREELMQSLKEWQKILQLEDWYIRAALMDERPESVDDLTLGENFTTAENKEALIVIYPPSLRGSPYMKECDELTLVHELLHCLITTFEDESETVESAVFALMEDQKIEALAKAFIMARYGVSKAWFFKDEWR